MHTRKEPLAHPLDIRQPELVELVRHAEDDVVVRTGQQTGLLLGKPTFNLPLRTWRAHAVPTRIGPEAFHMPLRTPVDVRTKPRGATASSAQRARRPWSGNGWLRPYAT